MDEALDTLPEMFRQEMGNLVVRVEDEPSEETLRTANVPPGHSLLGLYHGVPLTKQVLAGFWSRGGEHLSRPHRALLPR